MRLLHIIYPGEERHLGISHERVVALEKLQSCRDCDYVEDISSADTCYLVAPYTTRISAIRNAAKEMKAKTIWLTGGLAPIHLVKVFQLADEYQVIATLDGKYKLGCAEEFIDLVYFYNLLLENEHVSVAFPILHDDVWGEFPCSHDGFARFSLIYEMIKQKQWNLKRKHYLYELDNPSELVAYSRGFTSAMNASLYGVMSARCYVDSSWGIQYSPEVGSFGFSQQGPIMPYTWRQQRSTFMLNEETMRAFTTGIGGEEVWASYKEKLNEHSDNEDDRSNNESASGRGRFNTEFGDGNNYCRAILSGKRIESYG